MIEDRPLWFDQLRPSMEPQLLADFTFMNPGEDMLEIGCGNGFITLLLAWKFPRHGIMAGLDVQHERVIEANHWKQQFEEQWCEYGKHVFFFIWNAVQSPHLGMQFDLIVSNPPFFPQESHRPAKSLSRNVARRDDQLTLEQLFQCVNMQLKPRGRFYLVFPKKRFPDVLSAKTHHGFEITDIIDHPSIRQKEGGIQLIQLQK